MRNSLGFTSRGLKCKLRQNNNKNRISRKWETMKYWKARGELTGVSNTQPKESVGGRGASAFLNRELRGEREGKERWDTTGILMTPLLEVIFSCSPRAFWPSNYPLLTTSPPPRSPYSFTRISNLNNSLNLFLFNFYMPDPYILYLIVFLCRYWNAW